VTEVQSGVERLTVSNPDERKLMSSFLPFRNTSDSGGLFSEEQWIPRPTVIHHYNNRGFQSNIQFGYEYDNDYNSSVNSEESPEGEQEPADWQKQNRQVPTRNMTAKSMNYQSMKRSNKWVFGMLFSDICFLTVGNISQNLE
jgi:hypothetical protein